MRLRVHRGGSPQESYDTVSGRCFRGAFLAGGFLIGGCPGGSLRGPGGLGRSRLGLGINGLRCGDARAGRRHESRYRCRGGSDAARDSAWLPGPRARPLGRHGFPDFLEVIRRDRPCGQVGLQCECPREALGRGVGHPPLELAHRQLEFPGTLLGQTRRHGQKRIARLQGLTADKRLAGDERSETPLIADPPDRPVFPERGCG